MRKKPHRTHKHDANDMTMQEHIRELRRRLFCVVFTIIVLFIFFYSNCNTVLDLLTGLGKESGYTFVYLSPQEVLLQQLRISFVLALMFSLPIILYQIVAYIAPMFSDRHYKVVALFGCTLLIALLVIGMLFAYKVILPFTYKFLHGVGETAGIQASVSIKEYISLFLTLTLCLGLVFELPLICIFLTRLDIVSVSTLKRGRKIMIVAAFFIGALITPPDAISQIIVAVPIILLYQVSIVICSLLGKERKHERKNDAKRLPTEVGS